MTEAEIAARAKQQAQAAAVGLTTGSLFYSASSFGMAKEDYKILSTEVEFAVQQAWYGPYGEKEWHDISFVDQVPEELR